MRPTYAFICPTCDSPLYKTGEDEYYCDECESVKPVKALEINATFHCQGYEHHQEKPKYLPKNIQNIPRKNIQIFQTPTMEEIIEVIQNAKSYEDMIFIDYPTRLTESKKQTCPITGAPCSDIREDCKKNNFCWLKS